MRVYLAASLCAAMLALASAAESVEGWERLGARALDLRGERDTIEVGRNEGRFHSIMLDVDGSAIEMLNLRVIFGDGNAYAPPTPLTFDASERSRVIDLPGDTRIIRSITFNYRSLGAGGRATITAYGR
jgi:hypothetical protein